MRGRRSSKWLGGSLNVHVRGVIGASIPPFGTKASRPAAGRKNFASGSPCVAVLFPFSPLFPAPENSGYWKNSTYIGSWTEPWDIFLPTWIVPGSSESCVTILPSQLLQTDGEHSKTKELQEHGFTHGLHSLWREFLDQNQCCVTVYEAFCKVMDGSFGRSTPCKNDKSQYIEAYQ